jgi:hypothetical protein
LVGDEVGTRVSAACDSDSGTMETDSRRCWGLPEMWRSWGAMDLASILIELKARVPCEMIALMVEERQVASST